MQNSKHVYTRCSWHTISICTKNREYFLGEIVDGKVSLSEIGKQAKEFWQSIPSYNSHVELGKFVIMPDHIYGIVGIIKPLDSQIAPLRSYQCSSTENEKKQYMSSISPKSGSLSVVIRSFKSGLTKWCRINGYVLFDWLPRFQNRIIQDQSEYNKIEEYISQYPENWIKQYSPMK